MQNLIDTLLATNSKPNRQRDKNFSHLKSSVRYTYERERDGNTNILIQVMTFVYEILYCM